MKHTILPMIMAAWCAPESVGHLPLGCEHTEIALCLKHASGPHCFWHAATSTSEKIKHDQRGPV